jgi:hypothetical protein
MCHGTFLNLYFMFCFVSDSPFYLVCWLNRVFVVLLGDEHNHKKVFTVAVMVTFRKGNGIQVCQVYAQLCL